MLVVDELEGSIREVLYPAVLFADDDPLVNLLYEIGKGEEKPRSPDIVRFSAGDTSNLIHGIASIGVPILAIWLWVHLHALRNDKETQSAEKRIEMILRLREKGLTLKEAERLADKTINEIVKRNKEDAATLRLLESFKTLTDKYGVTGKVKDPLQLLSGKDDTATDAPDQSNPPQE